MTTDESNSIVRLLPLSATLAPSDRDLICSQVEPVELKKDQFFLKKGEEVTKVAIVDKGILCRYYVDRDNHKIIDKFLFDNHFFTDREGYFSQQKSFTNIQAITPCHLWTIPTVKIEALKKIIPGFKDIIAEIIQQTLNQDLNLKNMVEIKDPLQRILRFYDLHPHYWQLISKRDIQIYLNISHTHFYELLNSRKKVRFRTSV